MKKRDNGYAYQFERDDTVLNYVENLVPTNKPALGHRT